MSDKYLYDENGNYKGKISDDSPSSKFVGTPIKIIDRSWLKKHFWKLAIFFSIMILIGGIIDGEEWYKIIGLMFLGPIIQLTLLFFFSSD
jgi:hypothetical protein